MEWEVVMAQAYNLLEVYTINGISQTTKTAFSFVEGSQNAARPVDYLTLFKIKRN